MPRNLGLWDGIPLGFSDSALRTNAVAKALLRWAAAEREAWLDAVTHDPLLPGRILPSDHLWQQEMVAACQGRRRVEVLRDAGRQLRTFIPQIGISRV